MLSGKTSTPPGDKTAPITEADKSEAIAAVHSYVTQLENDEFLRGQSTGCIIARKTILSLQAVLQDMAAAQTALEKLVNLQSHYAGLLNQYDGGTRKQFKDGAEWIARMAEMQAAGIEP